MKITTEQLRERLEAFKRQNIDGETQEKRDIAGLYASAFAELLAMREAVPVACTTNGDLISVQDGRAAAIWPVGQFKGKLVNLYTAPPAPAVPAGYCIMPLSLTAENGAKAALSGEFNVYSYYGVCQSCGGDGCNDCSESGANEIKIPISWRVIKEIYRAAVKACEHKPKC